MTLQKQVLGGLLAAVLSVVAPSAYAADVGAAPPSVINLNTASASELEQLPGIGEARAKAIVEARKERGGFKSIDDLGQVKGIGEKALEKLRPLVTIGSRAGGGPR